MAIGDPGDGIYVLKRLKQYNGLAEEASDQEIADGIMVVSLRQRVFSPSLQAACQLQYRGNW